MRSYCIVRAHGRNGDREVFMVGSSCWRRGNKWRLRRISCGSIQQPTPSLSSYATQNYTVRLYHPLCHLADLLLDVEGEANGLGLASRASFAASCAGLADGGPGVAEGLGTVSMDERG